MAWSRLQSKSATVSSGNASITFASNLTAGSKLIAAVSVSAATGGADPVSSVKDGAGNSFTELATVQNSGGPGWLELWAIDTPAGDAGTAPTITATVGTNSGVSLLVQEVSGLLAGNTSAMLDGSAGTNFNGSTGPATTGAYTSHAANEYLVAIMGDNGFTVTVTDPASGYTADTNDVNTSGLADLIFNYKNSTNGSESASFTLSANDQWQTLLVAFKLAAAAAAGGIAQAIPGRTWLRRFHHPQQLPPPFITATAASPQVLPPHPRPVSAHRSIAGRAACAAGILAATTLSPQPTAVPPARPQPVIAHPAPHRATAKGILAPASQSYLTAKLPPTAVSPRPPHRAITRRLLATTTLSPQPSSVPAPLWRQPVPPRPAHRAVWRALAGPAPAVVVPPVVAPSKPSPTVNRPSAPHRAIWRTVTSLAPTANPVRPPPVTNRPLPPHRAIGHGILATTTLSPQPSRVPPPQWRQPVAPRPAHRAVFRTIAGPAPAVVVVAAVPPSRPQPVTNRPPAPHRATGKGILAVTTLSAQPSRVPPPLWRQPVAPRPAHRAIFRTVAGPAPAAVGPAPAAPSRPRPTVNRPPAAHRGIWRTVTSVAPTATPVRPLPTVNRPPAPHRAIVRWLLAKTTLSAQPARVPPPQWRQPNAPRPAHRAVVRRIAGAAPPPPAFTIGQLTANDTARNTLSTAAASSTLTATGAGLATLTATDKRTGGPGG